MWLLLAAVEVNAAIVVPEGDLDLLVPPVHPDDLETLEHLDPPVNQVNLNKHRVNKSQLRHASLAQEVNLDSQDHLDRLVNPEALDQLDSLEDKHHLENLDQLDHLETLEHLDSLEHLDNLEHLHNLRKLVLHHPAHLETLELLVNLEILAQLDNLEALEHPDQKDHLAHLDRQETMVPLDNLEPPDHQEVQERRVSVQNIAQSTVESSSKMALDDVKCFPDARIFSYQRCFSTLPKLRA